MQRVLHPQPKGADSTGDEDCDDSLEAVALDCLRAFAPGPAHAKNPAAWRSDCLYLFPAAQAPYPRERSQVQSLSRPPFNRPIIKQIVNAESRCRSLHRAGKGMEAKSSFRRPEPSRVIAFTRIAYRSSSIGHHFVACQVHSYLVEARLSNARFADEVKAYGKVFLVDADA